MERSTAILKNSGLRVTNPRKKVLDTFLRYPYALAQSELEEQLADTMDRVTMYRTLKSFTDSGVLHKVIDDQAAAKFALCSEECSTEDHRHNHLHFKCLKCQNTQCLHGTYIPELPIPEGFQVQETNVLVQGTCRACAQ